VKPPAARIVLAVRSRPRRALILSVAALVIVTVVGYGSAAAYTGNDVPRGTEVSGVDIGGLSERAAVERLDQRLGPRAAQPLRVRVRGQDVTLDPAKAGLSLDSRATVDAAMEGRFGFVSVFSAVFGGREITPQVRMDEARFAAALGQINKRIGTPVREGAVKFRGTTPEPVLPQQGTGLDARAAAAPIKAAFLAVLKGKPTTPELQTSPLRPKADANEIRQVAAGPARVAVSGPVTLAVDGKRVTVQPRSFAPHLVFAPDDSGKVSPRIDGPGLARELGTRLRGLERPARDATFKVKSGKLRLVPSVEGRAVDARALGDAVAGAVLRPQGREVNVPMTVDKPRVATGQAGNMGIKQKISSFTTRHPCCAPRVKNIHTIADILDGYIVRPGETFSLNGIVGKRDKARGFVEAPMILNGRYVDDVGGGISQFATTMFNAVFFGGLQDVQHTPHSYYISRYPAGRESTVSFPQPDFRWRNDSPYGVLVDTAYTDTSLTVSFWSTERYDVESKSSEKYAIKSFESKTESGPKCIPMPGAEGFQIDVWRIFKQNGKEVRRQKFHTTYEAEPRITCR
jgi:vancomycin resistance protein YoaR